MRKVYLILFLGVSFSVSGQDLQDLLDCSLDVPCRGPVLSMEKTIEPGNNSHRVRKVFYSFNRDHQLAERVFKGERRAYLYDGDGRLVRRERYYGEILQEYTEREYRPDGWVARTYGSPADNWLKQCEVQEDSLGRPVWLRHSYPNSQLVVVQEAYFEDEEVLIRSRQARRPAVDRIFPYRGCIHILAAVKNEEGQVLRELEKPAALQDEPYLLEHRYRYDEYGNWILRVTYRIRAGREELLYRINRQIEYAPDSGT
jgi:hypothetical protein